MGNIDRAKESYMLINQLLDVFVNFRIKLFDPGDCKAEWLKDRLGKCNHSSQLMEGKHTSVATYCVPEDAQHS